VRTKEIVGGTPTYPQRLHALDITTGQELSGSPVEIQASVPGVGEETDGHGMVPFDPFLENSRPGMVLSNGVIYMAWASLCDIHPFHGWVMAYDAKTLGQLGVFNTSANGEEASIWQSDAGVASDSEGNVYVTTGNGTFDISSGDVDYGDSVIKL